MLGNIPRILRPSERPVPTGPEPDAWEPIKSIPAAFYEKLAARAERYGIDSSALITWLEDPDQADRETRKTAVTVVKRVFTADEALHRMATKDHSLLESVLEAIAENTRPKSDASTKNLDEQMWKTLLERPESRFWSSPEWAFALECGESTVRGLRMWQVLKVVKADAELTKLGFTTDGRRKPGRKKKPR